MKGPHMRFDVEIDAVGLLCPLPVLRLQKALRSMRPGQYVLLRTSDPAAVIDIPHFCTEVGASLVKCSKVGLDDLYLIRKLEA